MFRETQLSPQTDAFSSIEFHFSPSKLNKLNDPGAWHNRFFEYVTSKIDEGTFSDLFDKSRGRPNASVRVLVAMLFMKEGFGWSDEELFDQCAFNIVVMRALGLVNLNDEVPVSSTYYLFKQSLYQHQIDSEEDLIGEAFQALTEAQARVFGVHGHFIRMDSKLFGSNIANCCRLQLVLGCLRQFWKSLSPDQRRRATSRDQTILSKLLEQTPSQLVYRLTNEEKASKLRQYGKLLRRLIKLYEASDSKRYDQIRRVFDEQFSLRERKVVIKNPKETKASSLQSPHDPDAAYSGKANQNIKGYRVNLTETCNPNELNLVTHIQVEAANCADTFFVESAVENTESIVGEVKEVSLDGAYYSPMNIEYAEDNHKDFHFSGMQSTSPRFAYRYKPNQLEVIDTKTGAVKEALEYKPGKYKALFPDRCHYFTDKEIQSYQQRQKIDQMPEDIRKRRNNVEASLFQMSCFTRNKKTRYRRLYPHRLWAFCRAAWMNLVRIIHYLAEPPTVTA